MRKLEEVVLAFGARTFVGSHISAHISNGLVEMNSLLRLPILLMTLLAIQSGMSLDEGISKPSTSPPLAKKKAQPPPQKPWPPPMYPPPPLISWVEISLLDFNSPESLLSPSWWPQDDRVMGGKSESALLWSNSLGSAVFTGNVTTANNGGFASCRSESWEEYGVKLRGAKGLRLIIKGDGKTYKLSVKMDNSWDGVMYEQDFKTKAASENEEWETVDLPFSRFKPRFRGWPVQGRPPLTGSKIRQLGFMSSKFNDEGGITAGFTTGNFRLAIRGIKGLM
jgi:hypothetical protein